MSIKILLVDDQMLFVRNLKIVLQNLATDIEVIGIAEDGNKAIKFLNDNILPDVILMDIKMPQINGIEATEIIHGRYPNIKILILSTYFENTYLEKALQNGAVGYLLKTVEPSNLIAAIRIIVKESIVITPHVVVNLLRKQENINYQTDVTDIIFDNQSMDELLSKREKEIFILIIKGKTNNEIGSLLSISPQSVRNRICMIYSKLGVNNRLELINNFYSEHGGINL